MICGGDDRWPLSEAGDDESDENRYRSGDLDGEVLAVVGTEVVIWVRCFCRASC